MLIVDDEESFRDVLKCVLDGEGYGSTAATGREAIAKLEADKPDLVLLDLNLPDTDGWGVMQYMTQRPKFKDVEVLIISGLMLDEARPRKLRPANTNTSTRVSSRWTMCWNGSPTFWR